MNEFINPKAAISTHLCAKYPLIDARNAYTNEKINEFMLTMMAIVLLSQSNENLYSRRTKSFVNPF